MTCLFTFIIFLALSSPSRAGEGPREKDYADAWCAGRGGIREFVVSGGSRVDCLTATHAVEVEFAKKWKEAIGQALYYAKKTGRKPGIALIVESRADLKYWGRLVYTVKKNYPFIRLYKLAPGDIKMGIPPGRPLPALP